ncbi:MAG: Indolepyruvate ferredoxin oxidoreductase [Geobacteraceae bacterium]|nr:Indolepyruvate ferredoxin oxidoreductase [Geobacteraceae bacterium]
MDTKTVTNILLVGVGGQGILVASEIISEALMLAGFDVKKSEIHGMAQRGGSVVSHVRFGARVYSPIIPEGEADFLLGYELLETYRYLPLLKNSGKVVVNNLKINPPSVSTGQQDYPEGIAEKIKAICPASALVDGLALAKQAGSVKTANTVLIGALSRLTGVDEHYWLTAIERMVPGKTLEMNKKAFELGRGCAV